MQETLRASEAVIARQNRSRDSAKQQLHTDKVDSEKALTKVLDSRHLDKLDLTARIANEEADQKEAFRRLQELRDLQSQRIIQEIRLVEQELCRLTQAEQERKRTSSQQAISSLAEQRGKLLQLLQSLQKAKDRRETELQNRLVELEARKLRDQTDYWLVQYQRLMDKKPVALFSVQLIDPDVYNILEAADAMDYAANFEYHRITSDMLMSFTDADLLQIGVYTLGTRKSILRVLEEYISKQKLELPEPSAPPQDLPSAPPPPLSKPADFEDDEQLPQPSAPPLPPILARFESECCVCQERGCSIIFLPCGHVCCCGTCASHLDQCPLCRCTLEQCVQLST